MHFPPTCARLGQRSVTSRSRAASIPPADRLPQHECLHSVTTSATLPRAGQVADPARALHPTQLETMVTRERKERESNPNLQEAIERLGRRAECETLPIGSTGRTGLTVQILFSCMAMLADHRLWRLLVLRSLLVGLLSIGVLAPGISGSKAMVLERPLTEMLRASELVVAGRVIALDSKWDRERRY